VIVHRERAVEQGSYKVSIGKRKGRDLTWLVSEKKGFVSAVTRRS
jgi:hypothetical protein